jgi:hypothetical protein
MAGNAPAGNGLSDPTNPAGPNTPVGPRNPVGPKTPVGQAFTRSLGRAWDSETGRRRLLFLAGVIVVIVIIGLGALMFSSLSGETQSYRDGYSSGETAYGLYGSTSAQQACKLVEQHGSGLGGLGRGDNPAQWLKGCVASFNATQADN